MVGFVDDLLRAAQNEGRALSQSAASLLHTAQTNTSQLFQINGGRITGPLAAKFSPNGDPVVFFHNVVKSQIGTWVRVANNVAARAGRTSYKVTTHDGKKHDVPARTKTGDPFATVVLVVCLAAVNHPDIFIDEAGRVAANLNSGKGVDDVMWWPGSMAVAQGAGAGPGPGHGVVGFDDVIIGLVGLATALIGIATVVLPVLVSGVSFVVKQVTAATAPKDQAPAPAGGENLAGIPIPIILVVVAAAIALVLLWKPKAKAG